MLAQPRGWSASLPLLVKDLLGSSQTALVSRTITPDFISKTWLSLLCKLLFGKDMLMLRNEAEGSVPGCVTDVCMPLDESTSPLLQKQGFVQGFLALSLPCILDQPVREDAAAESTRVLASWEVVCVVVPAPSPECPHETSSHALRVHVHVPAVVEPEHANSVAVASSAVNGVPTMLMSLIQQLQYVARSLPAKQVVHVQTLSGNSLHYIATSAVLDSCLCAVASFENLKICLQCPLLGQSIPHSACVLYSCLRKHPAGLSQCRLCSLCLSHTQCFAVCWTMP